MKEGSFRHPHGVRQAPQAVSSLSFCRSWPCPVTRNWFSSVEPFSPASNNSSTTGCNRWSHLVLADIRSEYCPASSLYVLIVLLCHMLVLSLQLGVGSVRAGGCAVPTLRARQQQDTGRSRLDPPNTAFPFLTPFQKVKQHGGDQCKEYNCSPLHHVPARTPKTTRKELLLQCAKAVLVLMSWTDFRYSDWELKMFRANGKYRSHRDTNNLPFSDPGLKGRKEGTGKFQNKCFTSFGVSEYNQNVF